MQSAERRTCRNVCPLSVPSLVWKVDPYNILQANNRITKESQLQFDTVHSVCPSTSVSHTQVSIVHSIASCLLMIRISIKNDLLPSSEIVKAVQPVQNTSVWLMTQNCSYVRIFGIDLILVVVNVLTE